jgi:hypothetical protein
LFTYPKKHIFQIWPLIIILILFACTAESEETPPSSSVESIRQEIKILQTPTIFHKTPTNAEQSIVSTASPTIIPNTPEPTTSTIPTDTPALTDTIDEVFLEGPLVAFKIIDHQTGKSGILLLDLTTGIHRQLWLPTEDGELVALDWAHDGCYLYAITRNPSGVDFVTVDLLGEQIKKDSLPNFEGVYSDWTVAPTGDYIAYLVHSGSQELYYSEFQDVFVVPTDNLEATPIILTNQGWTFRPAWSFNGKYLAYSNFDSNNNAQLFFSNIDSSETVRLTNFPDIEHVEAIKWSPDSTKLAFTTIKEGQVLLWSINTDGSDLQEAILDEFVPNGEPWWTSNNQAYAILTQQWIDDHPVPDSDTIFWIDALTGEAIHQLLLSSLEGTNSEMVFPAVTGDNIGFFGEQIVIYTLSSESLLTLTSNPFTDSVRLASPFPLVEPGPIDFSGENLCE